MSHKQHVLRVVAFAVLLVFGFGTTHAGTLLTPPCAGCPADCPMHTQGKRCHEKSSGVASSQSSHCHKRASRGPGLRAGGCKAQQDRVAVSDQLAIVPALVSAPVLLPVVAGLVGDGSTLPAVTLDPPFHPPRLVLA